MEPQPVYDLLDAGPRSRFMVLGAAGPLIVHNCTQGEAATLLRELLTRVSAHTVLHTHDEVMLEVAEKDEAAMREYLQREMERLPPWAEGLPLKAEVTSGFVYEK